MGASKASNCIIVAATVATLLLIYLASAHTEIIRAHSKVSDPTPVPEPSCRVCPDPIEIKTVDTANVNELDLSGPNPEILPMFRHAAITTDVIIGKLANHMDFDTEWFRNVHKELMLGGELIYHRKTWELTYIAHIVEKLKLCGPGKSGLVWAAGKERLISYFASKGCAITATDMDPDGAAEKGWASTNQHSASKDALYMKEFLEKEAFDRLVSYRIQDMNHVPVDTRNTYDFTWSTCSMEHVGSIPLGQRFVMNAMDLLKPGGIAVHTVEFTLSSNEKTITSGNTVLWRKQDVDYLVLSLQQLGYEVFPIEYGAGEGRLDKEFDIPPYKNHDIIKIQIEQHIVTSIAIIVRKPESWKIGIDMEQVECLNAS